MKQRLRNPRLNAIAIGATYGIVQGLRLPSEQLLTSRASASDLLFIGLFGLLALPTLAVLRYALAEGPPQFPRWWEKLEAYFDPYLFLFAVSATASVLGAYALTTAKAQGGYQVCVFAGAVAPSFLAASLYRQRLRRTAKRHAI